MSQLINFNSNINNFFDEVFNPNISTFVGSDFASNIPSVNISETGDDFKIELAAPGLEKKDFDINIEKDQLIISVKKEITNEVNDDKFTRKEFNYTSFSRSFYLPKGVKKDKISAVYEDGILILDLPKKEEAKELPARAIKVK